MSILDTEPSADDIHDRCHTKYGDAYVNNVYLVQTGFVLDMEHAAEQELRAELIVEKRLTESAKSAIT